MMNKFYLAAILPMLAAGAGHAQESTEVDRVFAIVNEEVITRSEFERQLRDTVNEFRSRGAGLPEENVLRRRVLERMVDNRVQLQEAARLGFAVSEEDLAGALRGIAERNNLSVAQLRAEVEKQGMDYQLFRRGIRRQLLVEQLINRRIRSRVTVTDAEVDHHLAGSLREFFAGRAKPAHLRAQGFSRQPQIARDLHIQPNVGGGIQQLAEPHRNLRRHRPLSRQNAAQNMARDAQHLRKFADAQISAG